MGAMALRVVESMDLAPLVLRTPSVAEIPAMAREAYGR
jgi:hypothetical protein